MKKKIDLQKTFFFHKFVFLLAFVKQAKKPSKTVFRGLSTFKVIVM